MNRSLLTRDGELMLVQKKYDNSIYALLAVTLFVAAFSLVGCGGPTVFSDNTAIAIGGDLPPQPPPPPPPPPAAPKRVEVTADKIVINEKIMFDFDKSTIKPESFSLLDEVAQVIKDNPQIKKISVEGHTDSDGSDKYNQKLSDGRAASVKKYIVDKGVPETMLDSKGWGESKPIADNNTPEGKEKNRRVEFLITAQDAVKKTVEVDPKTGQPLEVKQEGTK
jgi:outer membrane protein OmpA-like peptidoglycan-associated protein